MKVNTEALITALTELVNRFVPTTYDEAKSKADTTPYAVVSGLNVTDLESGDLVFFYIDIWGDEKKENAAIDLERACDTLRNGLYNAVVSAPGLYGHIGFNSQSSVSDSEFDIMHRRLSMSARVFYY